MKMPQIIAKAGSDTADLMIYEPIVNYSESSGKAISKQLAELEGKVSKLRVFINSPGGSVVEGIAIFNLLQRTNMEVSLYVDGVAASMAGVLMQVPSAKRYMGRHTKMMLHCVSGMAFGSSDDLKQTAEMMEGFQNSLIEMIAERIGNTSDEVKAKYFDGKDHWLNAEQALEAKLIDGIVDGKLKVIPPKANDLHTLHNFYTQEILNFNKTDNKMLENLMNILGLSGEVTDQQVEDKVQAVLQQNNDLTAQITAKDTTISELNAQVAAFNQAKVDELIANAVTAGKITAESKPLYAKIAQDDFNTCKAILDSMPTYVRIADQLDAGATGIPEARKDWSFQDWQKKDGKGLAKLQAEQPEVFAELRKKLSE